MEHLSDKWKENDWKECCSCSHQYAVRKSNSLYGMWVYLLRGAVRWGAEELIPSDCGLASVQHEKRGDPASVYIYCACLPPQGAVRYTARLSSWRLTRATLISGLWLVFRSTSCSFGSKNDGSAHFCPTSSKAQRHRLACGCQVGGGIHNTCRHGPMARGETQYLCEGRTNSRDGTELVEEQALEKNTVL